MILEFLISGATLVGCTTCWVIVAKHKLSVELQKHKITTDYESIKPMPDPEPPLDPVFKAKQQSLTALLRRREVVESQINQLRVIATTLRVEFGRDISQQHREDALRALEDARKEQYALIKEQQHLLKTMGETSENSAEESIRIDSGGSVARSVEDPSELYDVELYDKEASRKGIA